MTPEIYERWVSSRPPFDGLTLSLAGEDLAPLLPLRRVLRHIVERLHERYGECALSTAADWHEHDGYVMEGHSTSWEAVTSWLGSDDALQAATYGDTYVRTAVMPEGLEFYLRFYVPDEYDCDYPERRGNFDLTCATATARELAASLESVTDLRLTWEPAKQFFDRSYSG